MKYPKFTDGVRMSVAALARRMIAEEKIIRGIKFPDAQRIIAREAGLLPGSLENLLRGRLKKIEYVAARLNQLSIERLERQLAATQHDLAIARARGRTPEVDLELAQASLENARRALGK